MYRLIILKIISSFFFTKIFISPVLKNYQGILCYIYYIIIHYNIYMFNIIFNIILYNTKKIIILVFNYY